MKKIALLIALVVTLGVAGAASAKISLVNHGDDSLFNLTSVRTKTQSFWVNNSATVEINDTVVNNTGAALLAGDDAEKNTVQSGDIDTTDNAAYSFNDVAVLNDECPCSGSSTSSASDIDVFNGEYGNDSAAVVTAVDTQDTDFATQNDLKYTENLNELNNTGAALAAADDAEDNALDGGKISRVRTRTVVGGRVTFGNNIPGSINL